MKLFKVFSETLSIVWFTIYRVNYLLVSEIVTNHMGLYLSMFPEAIVILSSLSTKWENIFDWDWSVFSKVMGLSMVITHFAVHILFMKVDLVRLFLGSKFSFIAEI